LFVGRWSGGVLRRFWSVWLVIALAGWLRLAFARGDGFYWQLGGDIFWTLILLYAYQPGRVVRQRKYRASSL
jgi:hypothetical protein